jgi:hypothetical protein
VTAALDVACSGEREFIVMTAASSLISELRSSLAEESARNRAGVRGQRRWPRRGRSTHRLIEGILQATVAGLDFAGEAGRGVLPWWPPEVSGGAGCSPTPISICSFCPPIAAGEKAHKDAVRRFSQELWDLKFKLSPASRTLAECERLRSQQH